MAEPVGLAEQLFGGIPVSVQEAEHTTFTCRQIAEKLYLEQHMYEVGQQAWSKFFPDIQKYLGQSSGGIIEHTHVNDQGVVLRFNHRQLNYSANSVTSGISLFNKVDSVVSLPVQRLEMAIYLGPQYKQDPSVDDRTAAVTRSHYMQAHPFVQFAYELEQNGGLTCCGVSIGAIGREIGIKRAVENPTDTRPGNFLDKLYVNVTDFNRILGDCIPYNEPPPTSGT